MMSVSSLLLIFLYNSHHFLINGHKCKRKHSIILKVVIYEFLKIESYGGQLRHWLTKGSAFWHSQLSVILSAWVWARCSYLSLPNGPRPKYWEFTVRLGYRKIVASILCSLSGSFWRVRATIFCEFPDTEDAEGGRPLPCEWACKCIHP